jgi:aspartyl-tRNA(Asn)/glutamyl-tRNA(Gln) amidotransferase subunit A
MGEGGRAELVALLRARLAAAGLEPPPGDTSDLERDLALHLERVATLTAAADLHPSDPPLPDPTRATAAGAPPGQGPVGPAAPARAKDLGLPGLVEQARMVREGEVSSVELVERALERIAALDSEVGAFVLVLGDQARAEAAERDLERRRGRVGATLHGVPVAVKDLIDVEGAVTGAGSVKLAGNRAGRDAEVVARLRSAGAVVVGKTRTHEFAYGVTTPGTANPWDLERSAGGSSGGSAAAVAARLVAGALGTDTAGSIRIPSSCCGVVGLKPTWGRVPATGVWPLSWSCDHVGPIAATVADVALLDEVLAGTAATGAVDSQTHRSAEPATVPLRGARDPAGRVEAGRVEAGRREAGRREAGRREGVRIGRVVGDDLGPVEPAVTAVVDELCRRMEAAGASVDEVVLPLRAARGAVAAIVLAEAAAAHVRLLAETGEDGYSRAMLAMIRIGRSALAGEYLTGLRYRGRFLAEVEGLLAGRDALLLPTLPCPAPPAGERTVTIAGTRVGIQAALTRLPGPFNCSGSPVISLPAGLTRPTGAPLRGSPVPSRFTGAPRRGSPDPSRCPGAPLRGSPDPSGGLPVGVSLVGRIGGDRALLSLAAWVEAVAPDIGRPAVHA